MKDPNAAAKAAKNRERKARASWRKQPSERGLARVCQSPRGYQLRIGDRVMIHVTPLMEGFSRTVDGWYWYGMGEDTCRSPCKTKEEAKAEADAWFKANYKEPTDSDHHPEPRT